MQRWSSQPLALPMPVEQIATAHLELAGVKHSGPSFVFYVFLNAGGELPADASREHPRFAAAMSVFAHGDCWGGPGHCNWRREPVSPFDRRPEHHLTPLTLTLDVTDALKALGEVEEVVAMIHAAHPTDRDAEDVLRFETLSLHAYA
jgi:tyrosinase